MAKIIKVTLQQLRESESDAFEYLDPNNDVHNFNGNSEIGVTGKIKPNAYGEPITGDKIGRTMTSQGYNRYRAYGDRVRAGSIRENDENNDGVDDFYNHDELDILSDGNEKNNLIKVPESAEYRLNNLLNVIEKLTPKQQAMVLNKLVETLDISNIPYSWAKELMHKIMSRNNVSR